MLGFPLSMELTILGMSIVIQTRLVKWIIFIFFPCKTVLFWRRGSLTPPNYIKYIRHDTLGTEYLNSSLDFASSAKGYYKRIGERLVTYGEIQKV